MFLCFVNRKSSARGHCNFSVIAGCSGPIWSPISSCPPLSQTLPSFLPPWCYYHLNNAPSFGISAICCVPKQLGQGLFRQSSLWWTCMAGGTGHHWLARLSSSRSTRQWCCSGWGRAWVLFGVALFALKKGCHGELGSLAGCRHEFHLCCRTFALGSGMWQCWAAGGWVGWGWWGFSHCCVGREVYEVWEAHRGQEFTLGDVSVWWGRKTWVGVTERSPAEQWQSVVLSQCTCQRDSCWQL